MDLENIFDKINITSCDKILVHSNILKILIKLKKKNKKFNANLIIDSLINKVGPNGTIIFPTYIGISVKVKVLIIIKLSQCQDL